MKNIIIFVIILAIIVPLTLWGANNSEKVECIQWQKQAMEYPSFFATTWQVEQCNAHNINIFEFVD